MIYKTGMLCKHFKGKNLEEKNIYKIIKVGVLGSDVDTNKITYTGDGDLSTATNLVVYANIFQDNKLFAREYEDISGNLTDEKQQLFLQQIKVQPLTDEEIAIVKSPEFISAKELLTKEKFR